MVGYARLEQFYFKLHRDYDKRYRADKPYERHAISGVRTGGKRRRQRRRFHRDRGDSLHRSFRTAKPFGSRRKQPDITFVDSPFKRWRQRHYLISVLDRRRLDVGYHIRKQFIDDKLYRDYDKRHSRDKPCERVDL